MNFEDKYYDMINERDALLRDLVAEREKTSRYEKVVEEAHKHGAILTTEFLQHFRKPAPVAGNAMWTGNGPLDTLRSKAAASSTGVIQVSIEELNKILPITKGSWTTQGLVFGGEGGDV